MDSLRRSTTVAIRTSCVDAARAVCGAGGLGFTDDVAGLTLGQAWLNRVAFTESLDECFPEQSQMSSAGAARNIDVSLTDCAWRPVWRTGQSVQSSLNGGFSEHMSRVSYAKGLPGVVSCAAPEPAFD